MTYRDAQTAWRRLVAVAQRQGGYVTAKQARRAGFDYSHLAYHAGAGNLVRAGHGLYRVPELPRSPHDQLVRLVLWSRGRDDRPQAIVSHDSALALHELSDAIPTRVHLSVPIGFRKRAPRGCVLHRSHLAAADAEDWEGLRISTPLRTLIDLADEGRFGREQLGRAVEDALARGLVRRSQLEVALRVPGAPVTRARLDEALVVVRRNESSRRHQFEAWRATVRRQIDAGLEQADRGQLVDGERFFARLKKRIGTRPKRRA